MFLISLKIEY